MARAPRSATPATSAAVVPSAAWGVLAFVVALLAYWPALNGGFLWDDGGHITRPDLRSFDGLLRIWFEIGATQQYYPLLHSAFWLEHQLWGDAVLGYHLVNVALHATAACLFAALLRRLAVPGAWLAAFLFLLHPVCVESVAWIAEQKNTLSLVLYLGAALAYLRFDSSRRPADHLIATGVFLAALLTKTVTASLPAALLVVGWWQRGRLEWRRDVLPLLPWFALGAGSGLLTAWFEREIIGAAGAEFELGFVGRGLLACRVVWFYLGKLLWPAGLSFMYPRWTIDAAVWWQWLFPAATLALLVTLFRWRARSRAPLAVALLFGGSLFPVLGFFNVYPFLYSYVADHFQYLASLALFAGAGAVLTTLPARWPAPLGKALATLLPVGLGLLTWQQSGMYRDAATLYQATLERNPTSWMAHNNLAILLVASDRADDALPHYEAALRLRPAYPEGEHNFGFALNRLGRHAEARPHLERAVSLKPDYAEAHNELGVSLMGLGRTAEGLARFEQAVQLDPRHATAQRNLGLALASAGRVTEALPHFERAVALAPDDVESRVQLGTAYFTLGRAADAVRQLQTALEREPDSALAHYSLALALRALGRNEEAGRHYQEAVRLDPRLRR
jgi:tetratricopeptide (TPR) repeat protein